MSWTELVTLLIMAAWRTLTGRNKIDKADIDLSFLDDVDDEDEEGRE